MEISALNTLSGLGAALIGALIGGGISLYTTHKSFQVERARDRAREEKEVRNILVAMQTEIATLWQFHMRKVGTLIETLHEGEVLKLYYPLTQDYFTVYHSSAVFLGKIRDDTLRSAIVTCYNKCKKVVDGFKYHNDLLLDHRALLNSVDDSAQARQRTDMKYRELQDYSRVLREDHFELKGYVEELIALIDSHKA